jgi:hypothetical protein
MSDAIVEHGKNAHGEVVESGRYVVSPDETRVVYLQRHIPMKEGWRLATQADIDRVSGKVTEEAKPADPEPAPAPAPASISSEPAKDGEAQ